MDNITKKQYAQRLETASPLQLVIINYELAIAYVDEAIEGNGEGLNNARALLNELMLALNMEYEISRQLMSVYIYTNKLFINAGLKLSANKRAEAANILGEAKGLLENLLDSWKELETKGAVPQGGESAQQLYAGLTYRNGRLSEYIDEDKNRGFKA